MRVGGAAHTHIIGPTCALAGPRARRRAQAASTPRRTAPLNLSTDTRPRIRPRVRPHISTRGYSYPPTTKQPRLMFIVDHQHNEKSPQDQHVASFHPESSPPTAPENTKTSALRRKRGGYARRRRDLNPRGAMHPYLLSREAHSTGLCDVSSADYFRAFSPRARTCTRRDAHGRPAQRRARDSNPRCHC